MLPRRRRSGLKSHALPQPVHLVDAVGPEHRDKSSHRAHTKDLRQPSNQSSFGRAGANMDDTCDRVLKVFLTKSCWWRSGFGRLLLSLEGDALRRLVSFLRSFSLTFCTLIDPVPAVPVLAYFLLFPFAYPRLAYCRTLKRHRRKAWTAPGGTLGVYGS